LGIKIIKGKTMTSRNLPAPVPSYFRPEIAYKNAVESVKIEKESTIKQILKNHDGTEFGKIIASFDSKMFVITEALKKPQTFAAVDHHVDQLRMYIEALNSETGQPSSYPKFY
jgi:hypothetical protein